MITETFKIFDAALNKDKFLCQLAIENMKSSEKVFCIGFNKTGTTSLNNFMEANGFDCGDQASGELLMRDYSNKNWKPIIEFCQTATFFQDLPFSAPQTTRELLEAYPRAKFILTQRLSTDAWYQSICRFHKIFFKAAGQTPTAEELKASPYRYPGFAWEANRALYNSPSTDPYNERILKNCYEVHNEEIKALFAGNDNFLALSIEDSNAIPKLEAFLDIKSKINQMPWLNKTASKEP